MTTRELIQNAHKTQIIIDLDSTICDILIDWSRWEIGLKNLFSKYENRETGAITDENQDQNKYVALHGDKLLHDLTKFIEEYEYKYTTGFAPIANTVKLIEELKDLDLYVWSANSETTIKKALAQLGIDKQFKHVVGRESIKMQKPDPEGFNIIHALNPTLDKSSYIFIGNAPNDSQAAINAGIEYINVNEIVV